MLRFNLLSWTSVALRFSSPAAIECDNDNNARAASSLMPEANGDCATAGLAGLLSLNLAKADSQSSNSLKNRPIACPSWRSRKPRINDPARPNKDEEKAVAIPDNGASSPSRSWVIILPKSVASASSEPTTRPTAPIVCNRPQNVPSRPKNTNRPII